MLLTNSVEVFSIPGFWCTFATPFRFRDVAQPGSALAWGARGRWFESSRPDSSRCNSL